MLYKLGSSENRKFNNLEPVEFKNFSNFGKLEKDLEELIADNILDTLFEESGYMPISQERARQPEADIYALNKKGELIIFELKREVVGEGAIHQALRYAQDAYQWSYAKLEEKYRQYREGKKSDEPKELLKAHKEAFDLKDALDEKEINKKQHLFLIGSAADDKLINAIDYWKRQGISIEFLPYRIYELGEEKYFEFFALPYDKHRNPRDAKGVLFDTNKSYGKDSIWYMIEKSRVAAFGDAGKFIGHIYRGDIVFFSHKGCGLVAAAEVKGDIKDEPDTRYRDVEFITPIPKKEEDLTAMPFKKVSLFTGKNFFWARTIKVPYLSKEEADNLVEELKKYLKVSI